MFLRSAVYFIQAFSANQNQVINMKVEHIEIYVLYRIYSPISRFAYKSVGIFKVILEVFEIDSPISRYHFSPELVNNFRSIFCCLYWRQIKIF
jgi:hypothetical protein